MNIIKRFAAASLATLAILAAITVSTSADESDDSSFKGPRFNPEHRETMMEVIENCDYDDWYNALTEDGNEPPILEHINEGNFARFCEMHDLRTQAREIAEELGLPQKGMHKRGHGQRPELTDEQKVIMEQVRELMQAGNKEGAKELLKEADLPFGKKLARWNKW